jgi:hypothetical protein
MAERTPGAVANGDGHDVLDPEELAREVRQFAIDAHRALTRPDTPIDVVIGLRQRLGLLLRKTRGSGASEINRWLRRSQGEIEARLPTGPRENLELSRPG